MDRDRAVDAMLRLLVLLLPSLSSRELERVLEKCRRIELADQ